MIENGLDGGFSLTVYRLVLTQAWSVTIAAGDQQVIELLNIYNYCFFNIFF